VLAPPACATVVRDVRTFYLVRHCQASGQAPDAALTAAGLRQADALAGLIAPLGVERIVSSPFRRATQSAMPLATRTGLSLETDARLCERVLTAAPREDWRELLRASFAAPELAAPGGESGRAAAARALAVLAAARHAPARSTVLVTHGNLLAILLGQIDPSFGFEAWERLTNPDVYRLRLPDGAPLAAAALCRLWVEPAPPPASR
jgi:2,3-bisphosphoglycerate-dependent phosphoglycerate mutase